MIFELFKKDFMCMYSCEKRATTNILYTLKISLIRIIFRFFVSFVMLKTQEIEF